LENIIRYKIAAQELALNEQTLPSNSEKSKPLNSLTTGGYLNGKSSRQFSVCSWQ